MGRLINAEILTDYIVEHDLAFEYAIKHQDRKELERLIAEIPTAYDPDKVVEQLEKKIQTHKRVIEYENKNGTITEEFQQRKAVEVLEGAIEIVKGGGVNGD